MAEPIRSGAPTAWMDVRACGAQGDTSRVELEFTNATLQHRAFFASSDAALSPSGEAMVAAGLIPAMYHALPLRVHADVSALLLERAKTIQDIYAVWNPAFSRIPVTSSAAVARTRPASARVATFFSGGVDSFYTLVKNQAEITDLIFIHGTDISLDNHSLRERTSRMVHDVARTFGKHVIEIESDLKAVLDRYCNWGTFGHGPTLATIGHLLGRTFHRIYIPSSYTYMHLFPWGSHPLLDPLWSTEALQFVHDGCEATRVEKVELIAGSDIALRYLRVCWRNLDGQYNCGRCEKCVRTMINLRAVGVLDRCTTFPVPLRVGRVLDLSITTPNERAFVSENLVALERRGLDPHLQRALRRLLTRPVIVNAIRRWLGRFTNRHPSVMERLRQLN